MEYCLAAAALNAVDRRSLQRSARLGREVLERAKRRAVDWHSPERSRGCVGVLYGQDPYQERWSVPGPQSLLGEKYYLSTPEEGGATHVYRYHRRKPAEVHVCSDSGHREAQRNCRGETSVGPGSIYQTSEHSQESSWPIENISKDLYIEVYPGTYSVTVGSGALSKKTHVVAVDSGQSVDLVFPV
ncbi:similar to C11orf17 protein (predicted), isoform CRA_f [Rattus norvegicus]|uniref:Similar to C11orf17 protein (Predicted), isoform CRA_f n=1 Tax=Rattus norvegicus TaxID=10116 RepID=A6I7Y2_RAT|nr:A-kinase-interacting protein 1 isoform X6 [Rattus norvegicus]XP_038938599.1 A-kinase-interacting protein 1 isoform X6 [Rattus norvegicus]EDM17901.1 similar to C11orf17 protein (predicted), isoform CRA_f [Rattus norvegicus]